ncbi:MAG: hypothetical protein IKT58_05970 [Oscillospiraceae bacterium]|nr:hypothetical protein [Oscillospiraceae bacterium]
MVTRKYTKDYRIETNFDLRGRVREKVIYCGAYYCFSQPISTVWKHFKKLLILTALALLAVILPMAVQNSYLDRFYVFLPHGFAVIPVYLLCAAMRRIYMAKDRQVIREHRDKIVHRLEKAGVFLLVVSILSVAVLPVYLVLESPGLAEWIMMLLTVGRLALAWLILPMYKDFVMEELPSTSELPKCEQ